MRVVGEHMVGEGVLVEVDEEDLPPSIVIVGDTIEGDGDEILDVDDAEGLGVDSGVLGFEGVEGGLAIGRGLGCLALALCLGGRRGGVALLLGVSHGRGRIGCGAGEGLSATARGAPARDTAAVALADNTWITIKGHNQ
jgi:hypothetical protein